jgi:hypothetical protein
MFVGSESTPSRRVQEQRRDLESSGWGPRALRDRSEDEKVGRPREKLAPLLDEVCR